MAVARHVRAIRAAVSRHACQRRHAVWRRRQYRQPRSPAPVGTKASSCKADGASPPRPGPAALEVADARRRRSHQSSISTATDARGARHAGQKSLPCSTPHRPHPLDVELAGGTYLMRYQVLQTPAAPSSSFSALFHDGLLLHSAGTDGAPRLLWKRISGKYHIGYGPSIVLADMDNDGQPEIVIASKPACVYVLDCSRAGKIRLNTPSRTIPTSGGRTACSGEWTSMAMASGISSSPRRWRNISVLHNEAAKPFGRSLIHRKVLPTSRKSGPA